MSRLEEIKCRIDELKTQLNLLTEAKDELCCSEVLKTSELLDELINQFNKVLIDGASND